LLASCLLPLVSITFAEYVPTFCISFHPLSNSRSALRAFSRCFFLAGLVTFYTNYPVTPLTLRRFLLCSWHYAHSDKYF
jgi:hypothetical protein